MFLQLPPSSSYAQHRIKVLQTALALLDKEAGWVGGCWMLEGCLVGCRLPLPGLDLRAAAAGTVQRHASLA